METAHSENSRVLNRVVNILLAIAVAIAVASLALGMEPERLLLNPPVIAVDEYENGVSPYGPIK
jgi:hypothetical protein